MRDKAAALGGPTEDDDAEGDADEEEEGEGMEEVVESLPRAEALERHVAMLEEVAKTSARRREGV